MAGNAWEWTADCGAGGGRCAQRVIKGGSWATALHEMRIGNRAARAPHTRSADIGFRCARDAAD
jgi:formylglycine-generating enzyme required for sulfatase activity